MKKNFVRFYSPGTFVSEETVKEIDSWDIDKAVEMSKNITERHNARPYGFVFFVRERADTDLDSHITKTSPVHYLGGAIFTLDEIKSRKDEKDNILIANMEGNGWDRIIENRNSWKTVQVFRDGDILLDVGEN